MINHRIKTVRISHSTAQSPRPCAALYASRWGHMQRKSILGLIAIGVLVSGCSDGVPIVIEAVRIPSPDSVRELIVEQIDNGLGFGMGRIVFEIHIQDVGTPVNFHGDDSVTAVFYVVEEQESSPPVVKWIGNDRVSVTYLDINQPAKKLQHFMGVNFEYIAKSANAS